jgi:hypothetical protein
VTTFEGARLAARPPGRGSDRAFSRPRSRSRAPADYLSMDRIRPLLHRLTGTPYADLNVAVRTLTADQLARLDALAGEILEDARAFAVVDNRVSGRWIGSDPQRVS